MSCGTDISQQCIQAKKKTSEYEDVQLEFDIVIA
jgi:hypothetical protein